MFAKSFYRTRLEIGQLTVVPARREHWFRNGEKSVFSTCLAPFETSTRRRDVSFDPRTIFDVYSLNSGSSDSNRIYFILLYYFFTRLFVLFYIDR